MVTDCEIYADYDAIDDDGNRYYHPINTTVCIVWVFWGRGDFKNNTSVAFIIQEVMVMRKSVRAASLDKKLLSG